MINAQCSIFNEEAVTALGQRSSTYELRIQSSTRANNLPCDIRTQIGCEKQTSISNFFCGSESTKRDFFQECFCGLSFFQVVCHIGFNKPRCNCIATDIS